ncbi:hypothetical protein [Endozoicomonas numazuensis]|uniref:hypothetical protein n=1 Tax=Endozoicomonas numazuensis TaxID=1137799 RepID=UPI000B28CBD5|nr:hypothetical protein [Endozoicomonas numazuensis]
MNTQKRQRPVIKDDLPEHEHTPFQRWLRGQTVPINEDKSVGFYWHDYQRWKAGLPIVD